MQRYFVEGPVPANGEVQLSGDDARHITKVMRGAPGDRIIIVMEEKAYEAAVESVSPEVTAILQTEITAQVELPVKVTIACGLPKGDKLELITQKATELGMHALLPIEAERSIVKWDASKAEKKTGRLRKIAKEAAEQSHRTHVPHIHTPCSFQALLEHIPSFDAVIVAYEDEARSSDRTRFADTVKRLYDKDSILMVFGPEGGFSEAEVSRLRSAGALFTSLGPRILRAETAPLYALSAFSYEYE
ncbi:16S rRNA (uracil(1498)-N(3))-methyltransferase [Planococcus lenghuensis]|uniref:Ribosomal RNA small subunit methyltransferase E n=1 Tax=Planococcus lenghuensis TaxID=2213202 RepID=A0A1Q2KXN6_9BACL|nr:16S rRNA (uracil(1498)-N(3))-methyltransferase [Planococcus lenghuensis]AQQ52960.1 16S rRNA (uracil(1498)-N(3))-methyltransferase [Planococcus lenghuensis]